MTQRRNGHFHEPGPVAVPTELDSTTEGHVRAHFAGIPFLRTLRVTLHALRPGHCEMRMAVTPELTQQHGYLHGGIIGTLADSASGHAALTLVPNYRRGDRGVITVEYKLNFLAPADGERLIVRADVLKSGRTLTVCEAHAHAVRAGAEIRCASAIVTYILLSPR